jgi:hypothetical protein
VSSDRRPLQVPSARAVVILVLAALTVGACRSRSEAPARAPRKLAAPVVQRSDAPPSDGALASVAELDCSSSLPEKQGETLRAMRGPGPSGSAFNWHAGDLLCDVRFYVGCRTSGRLQLAVGAEALPVEEFGHTTGGWLSARVRVPRATWTAVLETRADLLYRTLAVSARVEGACVERDAGTSRTYEARDAFVAGFAEGE